LTQNINFDEEEYYLEILKLQKRQREDAVRVRGLKNWALQAGTCTHKHSEKYTRPNISGLEYLTKFPAGARLRVCLVCDVIFKETTS